MSYSRQEAQERLQLMAGRNRPRKDRRTNRHPSTQPKALPVPTMTAHITTVARDGIIYHDGIRYQSTLRAGDQVEVYAGPGAAQITARVGVTRHICHKVGGAVPPATAKR